MSLLFKSIATLRVNFSFLGRKTFETLNNDVVVCFDVILWHKMGGLNVTQPWSVVSSEKNK